MCFHSNNRVSIAKLRGFCGRNAMTSHEELVSTLYLALAEPIGLLLASDNPTRGREALYRARAKANDEDLARLQIRLVDWPDGQIAIVKGARVPVAVEPPRIEQKRPSVKDLDL